MFHQLTQSLEQFIFPRIKLHSSVLLNCNVGPQPFGNDQALSVSFSYDSFSPELVPIPPHRSKVNRTNTHRPEPSIACGVPEISVFVCSSDEYAPSWAINSTSAIRWSSAIIGL